MATTSLNTRSIRNTQSIPKYRPVRRNIVRLARKSPPVPPITVLSLKGAAVV
jgi:hypothetical protein